VVLAGGLLVIVLVLCLTLLQSAPRRSGTDLTPEYAFVTGISAGGSICQNQEILPEDTAALMMTIGTYGKPGPALHLTVAEEAGRRLTSGGLPAGWRQGTVRIPVARAPASKGNVVVCLHDLGPGGIAVGGDPGDPGYSILVNGHPFFAHLRIEYMRPGSESWFALLPTVIHRFSLGKSNLIRHWAAIATLLAVLLAIGLAVRALLLDDAQHPRGGDGLGPAPRGRVRTSALLARMRAIFGRVPTVAWLCALAALANGFAWSLIVPPFNVPDENAHYAYVAQLAERGSPPHVIPQEALLSPAEDTMLSAIGFFRIVGEPRNPAPFTQPQQQLIEKIDAQKLSPHGSENALSATSNPPLYYLLQVLPFKLAGSGKVLDRLAAMRVLSVLMGAITVLLIFFFLRELLPRRPYVWSAGALIVTFQPLFAFMSGGVNNDNLVYLCAAGLMWGIARAFRRGLTPANGLLIGGFLGAGLITKFTMLGFIPAAALALALLLWRARANLAQVWRGGALALAGAAAPVIVYLLLNHFVWHRGAVPGGVGSVASTVGRKFNFREELSHVWQLFLPHLWMHPQFPSLPLWDTWWFKGFVGKFGWLDYTFTWWVYRLALVLLLIVGVLALGELVRRRRALRGRVDELSVYGAMVLGLWVEIGVQSYRYFIANYGARFEQARYLLPLLGLYAAIMALAMRFAGRRYGPVLAAALVVIAIGHNLFAQVFTIARYYT
jgi:hypothetical protein